MKKIKYVFLVILSLLYINVKAEGVCSKDELANLKELANNIEIKKNIHIREENSVVKQEVGLDVYYTIDVLNYNNNLDVRFKMNEEIFSYHHLLSY